MVTRSFLQCSHTVLTLLSKDVVRAEVQKESGITECVMGGAG